MTSKAASRPGETYELIGQDLGWNTRGRAGVSITFQDGDFQIQPFAHLGFETQSEQKQDELLASTLSGLLGSTRPIRQRLRLKDFQSQSGSPEHTEMGIPHPLLEKWGSSLVESRGAFKKWADTHCQAGWPALMTNDSRIACQDIVSAVNQSYRGALGELYSESMDEVRRKQDELDGVLFDEPVDEFPRIMLLKAVRGLMKRQIHSDYLPFFLKISPSAWSAESLETGNTARGDLVRDRQIVQNWLDTWPGLFTRHVIGRSPQDFQTIVEAVNATQTASSGDSTA
ncbi:uncharacterized protein MKK02DRAFT_41082 [Dioszegia hungarica]|uniref:Uncharacterized protein n=1 Tax=Dioszegia hungarica TaxID=4972 RepID=A0AA38LQ18_9TREE|nr:uncharacterized protein MKK02DRAFT_41082 [Dioszegia hungarica]KAI9632772.1 hypothetical protein MKK02DRAFT_41082 [Dioszegia hungarica]